jgi:deazaflavin-dependent oxidoreductase (nitroreductase family)
VNCPGKPAPSGIQRLLFRLPAYLYRVHLGWLFGHRLLLLDHIGRKTGRVRQTAVEVVAEDPTTGAIVIAAGFGPTSDWYRNLRAHPDIDIRLGRRRIPVHARALTANEGAEQMADYARRHRRAAQALCRFMGFSVDGTPEDYRTVGRQIPFMRLTPRE